MDFYAVHGALFHFDLPLYSSMKSAAVRTTDGLMAVLLAHKRNPCIKFQASSPRCATLAKALEARIQDQGGEMVFRQECTPTLFIVDRREDPVTPLLKPWLYQAMIHEHLGINYNRVNLKNRAGGHSKEEYVINPGFKPPPEEPDPRAYKDEAQDDFFARNMFKNFGEIGLLLKDAIEATSTKTLSANASIEDLQAMVADMPEMRHKNMIAMKHWDIFKELKKEVDMRQLFDTSTVEQELATKEAHDEAKAMCRDAVSRANTNESRLDALRLVMLYNLRYEKSKSAITEELVSALVAKGLKGDDAAMVKKVVQYGGQEARQGPGAMLFNNEDTGSKLMSMMGAKMDLVFGDCDANGLCQHTPMIEQVLTDLGKGKLDGGAYPELSQPFDGSGKEVILFIVGGATYAEAACVDKWNAEHPDGKVLLGGTHMHNSQSFMEEIDSFC